MSGIKRAYDEGAAAAARAFGLEKEAGIPHWLEMLLSSAGTLAAKEGLSKLKYIALDQGLKSFAPNLEKQTAKTIARITDPAADAARRAGRGVKSFITGPGLAEAARNVAGLAHGIGM